LKDIGLQTSDIKSSEVRSPMSFLLQPNQSTARKGNNGKEKQNES